MADLEKTTLNAGESLPPDTTEVSLSGGAAPDANTQAESSTAEDAKQPTFRDAVQDVIKKETATSSVAEGEGKTQADPNAAAAKATTDVTLTAEQQAEADKVLPFHDHPRWKQVMGDNKAMTAKLAAQEAEVTEFRQVREFMDANDLQPKEVARLFEVGALLKNDPVAARAILHKTLTDLDTAIGEILPADLQAKVDDGTVDLAAAKEMARTRFQLLHQQQVGQRQQQKTRQQLDAEANTRAEQAHGQLLQAMQTGVLEWENQVKVSDPDYEVLAPHIQRETELASLKNPPKTAADAVNLCKAAYESVKKSMSGFMPRRQRVAPGPQSVQSSKEQVTEAPKSIREIVDRGLNLT